MVKIYESDLLLCNSELVEYGVSYLDATDTFLMGRGNEYLDLFEDTVIRYAPYSTLHLYYEPNRSEFIAAGVEHVTSLIADYWNGTIIPECPIAYISDLADLVLVDARDERKVRADEKASTLELHAQARKLIKGLGAIPDCVLDRIRMNMRLKPDLVH